MHRRALLIIASIAVTWTAGERSADANDRKNYAGSECAKRDSAGIVTYSFSRIGNASTVDAMWVDCPVVKDAGGTASAWVHVLDRNPSQAVECILMDAYVLTTDATVYFWSDGKSSTGSVNRHQELIYGSMLSNAASHKFIACRIPPSSSGNVSYVASYSVDES